MGSSTRPILRIGTMRMTRGALWILLLTCGLSSQLLSAATSKSDSIYRTAASVLQLSPEQTRLGERVLLRGVVTRSEGVGLTIQDKTAGIWVNCSHAESFSPGDLLVVDGTVAPGGYSPEINAVSAYKIGLSPLPRPKLVTFNQLSSGAEDAQYVSIVGVLRSVTTLSVPHEKDTGWLKIAMPDGTINATIPAEDAEAASKLLDATIRVDAAALCAKNKNRQLTAPILDVGSIHNLIVLQPPPEDLFERPLYPIGRLMQYRSGTDRFHRVRVAGVVTLYEPGKRLVLEEGGEALLVMTTQVSKIELGDRVEALGFLAPEDSGPILEDAVLRFVSHAEPMQPTLVKLADITSGALRYNLVKVEGRLLRRVDEPSQGALLLQSDSNILVVEIPETVDRTVLRRLQEGSTILVSGITMVEVEGNMDFGPGAARVSSKLLIRSSGDIQIVNPPSWWTTLHVIYLAAIFALFSLVFLALVVYNRIERWKLQAVLEERERMAHEIHDTLAQSFAGIGFQLQAIRKAIPAGMPNLHDQVELARDLVRHSHKEARRSLKPLALDKSENVDVLPSLEECAHKMVEGGSVEIAVASAGVVRTLPQHIASCLVRIGQEAIANAIRHADPDRLDVLLTFEKNTVCLLVKDDGKGFVKSGDLLGFGLRGMRKRAAGISAKLEILSQPGEGTEVEVTVPLPPDVRLVSFLKQIWKSILE